ncbi:glycosyltransferase [Acetobacterium paludosum]|uniref:4,4'-diaponeurosporenoate glycosyltransferase n=1 Tax=Acetobacterium paludosum TaxID=52693 RepID=A0A923I4T3_9FIRM|nr:glycosyltransferase family 2 protein [Acetobacterium paludosum]MBC3889020.1 glycosyltransferase [Acetobacterium paludosum]
MTVALAMVLLGLIISLVLFHRFPGLDDENSETCALKISVIIPARNEEKSLPLLLDDLKKQTAPLFEIICVDDASSDNTGRVALSGGAKLMALNEKPAAWIGKSWACQNGADAARGDLFLFLDADVRLSPIAVSRLMHTYENNTCVISVQPYHKMIKWYEQFSLFFNLIQLAANGLGLPIKNKNVGLYGPVILINRPDYYDAGGHESIKGSIIDDVALGQQLKRCKIPFKLFLGDQDIFFRMYGNGFKELLQGWTKNQSEGAVKTPFIMFVMVFLWVTSCTSVPIQIIKSIVTMQSLWVLVYLLFYLLWIFELRRIASQIGSFSVGGIIGYPIYLTVFLVVFLLSVIKKIFHLKVVWKDREIRLGK